MLATSSKKFLIYSITYKNLVREFTYFSLSPCTRINFLKNTGKLVSLNKQAISLWQLGND
jgi:hypothetical protein